MWCIWNERKVRSFEDRETALLELKKMMLQSLYTLIAVFNRLPVSNFSGFFFFFYFVSLFLYIRGLSCILPVH